MCVQIIFIGPDENIIQGTVNVIDILINNKFPTLSQSVILISR